MMNFQKDGEHNSGYVDLQRRQEINIGCMQSTLQSCTKAQTLACCRMWLLVQVSVYDGSW